MLQANGKFTGVTIAFDEDIFSRAKRLVIPVQDVNSSNLNLQVLYSRPTFSPEPLDSALLPWSLSSLLDPTIATIENALTRSKASIEDHYKDLIKSSLDQVAKIQEIKTQEKKRAQLEQQKLEQQQRQIESSRALLLDKGLKSGPNLPHEPNNWSTRLFQDLEPAFNRLETQYNLIVKDPSPDVKAARIDITKRILNIVNTISGTQRQVNVALEKFNEIMGQYTCNLLTFSAFRLVGALLDSCEPGAQMYINSKSAWAGAHLLGAVCSRYDLVRCIYLKSIEARCSYIVPRLYYGDPKGVAHAHGFDGQNTSQFLKRAQTLVRFHLAFLIVSQSTAAVWTWFAGILNATVKPILKQPIPCILVGALQVASYTCMQYYGPQFTKMLDIARHSCLDDSGFDCATSMYMQQLKQLLENTGNVPEPHGLVLKPHEEH
ncbi:bifunctional mRNA export factor GLE1-like/GLE1-like superfamily [Babesia duncani]|uniref:mRNA export factor GLE1 n=1 Tax=Babesia duncani TaxID=323732 RepID=A0AAD9UQ57_9APIC|nr:bifunctional mRNA export factor GLE1-like/GLE1-like superfamily [Babesia duncani]